MSAGRILATQQARDAAKQMLALTGPVKEQVRRVLHHGGILADPTQWDSSLAGRWRHDWGPDTNQLNQATTSWTSSSTGPSSGCSGTMTTR